MQESRSSNHLWSLEFVIQINLDHGNITVHVFGLRVEKAISKEDTLQYSKTTLPLSLVNPAATLG